MHFYLETYIYDKLIFIGTNQSICSYLKDRYHNLYYFTGKEISAKQYKELLDDGFRRAGFYLYKPFCNHCWECQIIRIPVSTFKMSKSQKRIWKRLKDYVQYRIQKPEFSLEKLSIYYKYLYYVHPDSFFEDIKDKDIFIKKIINKQFTILNKEEQIELDKLINNYTSFFINTCLELNLTKELLLFKNNQLIGIGIFDIIEDYWSSVYFFYDPDYSKYSLGTFSALLEIELAKQYNVKYYYLGYYIEKCNKMNYKKNFRPNEIKKINEKNFRQFIK
ncbi:MAG: putative arginyl-tRNA--protein transferase [Leptospiraceae bacterium]|nr:MAG: putative arginyl-tRNA--protein transferase [Leptospiraceae bacterium]